MNSLFGESLSLGLHEYVEREVSFTALGDRIAGELSTPVGEGPYPAVLSIPASGPCHRYGYGNVDDKPSKTLAQFLASHGIACLAWDKPGTGRSTGDWGKHTQPDRTEKALTALRFLAEHEAIAPNLIGMFGISQGGMIAYSAAAKERSIAFAIPVGAPVVPGDDQTAFAARTMILRAGLSEESANRSENLFRKEMEYIRNGLGFNDFDRYQQQFAAEDWFKEIWGPGKCFHQHSHQYEWVRNSAAPGGHDHPKEWVSKTRCPILAILGEFDQCVPVRPTIAGIHAARVMDPLCQVTPVIIPNADHCACIDGKFAPGLGELLLSWITWATISQQP